MQITSRTNPLVKDLRALAQKKTRARTGEFLVEGIQPVLQAIQSRAEIRMFVVAPDLLTSKVAREALRHQERDHARIVEVSKEVFEAIAERENPTGLAAVVKINQRKLNKVEVDKDSLFVALLQVSNPGNLGTILRTADAVRASAVFLIGEATDPYSATALNASRGAVFSMPPVHVEHVGDLLRWARDHHVNIVTTSDRAPQTLWQAELPKPLLLLFGNEGEGLPDAVLQQGQAVQIPMGGAIDSLNLAVAAGVVLFECVRRTTQTDLKTADHE